MSCVAFQPRGLTEDKQKLIPGATPKTIDPTSPTKLAVPLLCTTSPDAQLNIVVSGSPALISGVFVQLRRPDGTTLTKQTDSNGSVIFAPSDLRSSGLFHVTYFICDRNISSATLIQGQGTVANITTVEMDVTVNGLVLLGVSMPTKILPLQRRTLPIPIVAPMGLVLNISYCTDAFTTGTPPVFTTISFTDPFSS